MRNVPNITFLILTFLAATVSAYELGDTVENFTLTDLAGQEVNLENHTGEIIVLNFFTTWCPGCNVEAEHLENDIWQVYADQGVTVIAIDIQEPLSLVQGWAAAMGVTYPIWMAPDWDLFQVFPQAMALPYNTILDGSLVIRYASMGFDLNTVTDMLDTLISEAQIPVENQPLESIKAFYR